MAKYHINPNTGRPNLCNPEKTSVCAYAKDGENPPHYDNKDEAKAAYEKTGKKEFGATSTVRKVRSQPKPILVEPSKMILAKNIMPVSYYDYDYDYSYCANGEYCGEDGDYCRDTSYAGLRIDSSMGISEFTRLVRAKLGVSYKDETPNDVQEFIDNYDHEKLIEEIEIYGEGDYYGDTVVMDLPSSFEKDLRNFYYKIDNAIDQNEILPYVRGKGIDTAGLSPVEAIKAQLASENNKVLEKVKRANVVRVGVIPFSAIEKKSRSQIKVAADNPLKPEFVENSGTNKNIAGVLLQIEHGKYELLDGYHRSSFLEKSGKKNGEYVIIAEDRYLHYSDRINNSWEK